MKIVPISLLLCTFAFAFACSSSTTTNSNGTSNGDDGDTVDCKSVCAHVADICGQELPGCTDACDSWSKTEKSCVNKATTCSKADSCGDSSSGTDDSSQSDDDDTSTKDAGKVEPTKTECSNGVKAGESACLGNDFNTFTSCEQNSAGGLKGTEIKCGGKTPSCAAYVKNGVSKAACCPAGNVGEPDEPDCVYN